MKEIRIFGIAALLSIAIATPVLARPVIQEAGSYSFHRPNSDFGLGKSTATKVDALAAFQRKGLYIDVRHASKRDQHLKISLFRILVRSL